MENKNRLLKFDYYFKCYLVNNMIKQWSLKKIEISFFASTKKRILNRNSLKNFVAYFYKLFDINLISRFPKPVQTTDLEINFFSKKKGKKKRKKEKEKIQRQVQKKKPSRPIWHTARELQVP